MKKSLGLLALLAPLAALAGPLDLLTFAKIQRGMSEGDLVQLTGPADQVIVDAERPVIVKSYYYFANQSEPNTTRVIVSGGTVTDIQRERKIR